VQVQVQVQALCIYGIIIILTMLPEEIIKSKGAIGSPLKSYISISEFLFAGMRVLELIDQKRWRKKITN
jgi:hypothetical protein